MVFLFLLSLLLRNNGVADIGYGIAFLVVITVTILQVPALTQEMLVLVVLPYVWGTRLATRILLKNKNKPEDFRYKTWRDAWGKWFIVRSFFQIYMLQGVVIATVSSPVVIALVYGTGKPMVPLFIGGIMLWIIGFFFESAGDYQLDTFIKNPENKGKIMMSGLWSCTRHPNYFGESMMWLGIWITAVSFSSLALFCIISPVLITFLLLKVSGVPLLEKRWEGNKEWEEYKSTTPVFFPFHF